MRPNDTEAPGSRDRLIAAMSDFLQRRGLHGVGVSEILAAAEAPKGVLYHHFPGGKTELAVAAIHTAAARIKTDLAALAAAAPTPAALLSAWFRNAEKRLEKSGFERGCPLATVALESTPEDRALRDALREAFDDLKHFLGDVLVAADIPPERAPSLAALIVAAYEGALIQSRVSSSTQAVADVAATLVALLEVEPRHAHRS